MRDHTDQYDNLADFAECHLLDGKVFMIHHSRIILIHGSSSDSGMALSIMDMGAGKTAEGFIRVSQLHRT